MKPKVIFKKNTGGDAGSTDKHRGWKQTEIYHSWPGHFSTVRC